MNTRFKASLVVVALCTVGIETVSADESLRSGFWGGLDIGAGSVERSGGSLNSAGVDFYMGIKAGYALHPQVLAGLELSGWNQEATDVHDSTKGEGLMQVFLISRLYPMGNSNLFAKVGGGWVRQWANSPSGKSTLDGWGATLGVGYDIPVSGKWAATPFLNYSFGETEKQKHQAITLGVGVSFY